MNKRKRVGPRMEPSGTPAINSKLRRQLTIQNYFKSSTTKERRNNKKRHQLHHKLSVCEVVHYAILMMGYDWCTF